MGTRLGELLGGLDHPGGLSRSASRDAADRSGGPTAGRMRATVQNMFRRRSATPAAEDMPYPLRGHPINAFRFISLRFHAPCRGHVLCHCDRSIRKIGFEYRHRLCGYEMATFLVWHIFPEVAKRDIAHSGSYMNEGTAMCGWVFGALWVDSDGCPQEKFPCGLTVSLVASLARTFS